MIDVPPPKLLVEENPFYPTICSVCGETLPLLATQVISRCNPVLSPYKKRDQITTVVRRSHSVASWQMLILLEKAGFTMPAMVST